MSASPELFGNGSEGEVSFESEIGSMEVAGETGKTRLNRSVRLTKDLETVAMRVGAGMMRFPRTPWMMCV